MGCYNVLLISMFPKYRFWTFPTSKSLAWDHQILSRARARAALAIWPSHQSFSLNLGRFSSSYSHNGKLVHVGNYCVSAVHQWKRCTNVYVHKMLHAGCGGCDVFPISMRAEYPSNCPLPSSWHIKLSYLDCWEDSLLYVSFFAATTWESFFIHPLCSTH